MEGGNRTERHHGAVIGTGAQPGHVLCRLTERGISLGNHPIGATEQVKVIDIGRAEIDLERVIDRSHRNIEHFSPLPVDFSPEPRCAGRVLREHGNQPRIGIGLCRQGAGGLFEHERADIAGILQHDLEATTGTDTADRWRGDDKDGGITDHGHALTGLSQHRIRIDTLCLTVLKICNGEEDDAGIGFRGEGGTVKAGEYSGMGNAVNIQYLAGGMTDYRIGTLK